MADEPAQALHLVSMRSGWHAVGVTPPPQHGMAPRAAEPRPEEPAAIYVSMHPGLKSLLLQKRVEALSGALELKDAKLGEVLAAAHLDPATLQQVGGSDLVRVSVWPSPQYAPCSATWRSA